MELNRFSVWDRHILDIYHSNPAEGKLCFGLDEKDEGKSQQLFNACQHLLLNDYFTGGLFTRCPGVFHDLPNLRHLSLVCVPLHEVRGILNNAPPTLESLSLYKTSFEWRRTTDATIPNIPSLTKLRFVGQIGLCMWKVDFWSKNPQLTTLLLMVETPADEAAFQDTHGWKGCEAVRDLQIATIHPRSSIKVDLRTFCNLRSLAVFDPCGRNRSSNIALTTGSSVVSKLSHLSIHNVNIQCSPSSKMVLKSVNTLRVRGCWSLNLGQVLVNQFPSIQRFATDIDPRAQYCHKMSPSMRHLRLEFPATEGLDFQSRASQDLGMHTLRGIDFPDTIHELIVAPSPPFVDFVLLTFEDFHKTHIATMLLRGVRVTSSSVSAWGKLPPMLSHISLQNCFVSTDGHLALQRLVSTSCHIEIVHNKRLPEGDEVDLVSQPKGVTPRSPKRCRSESLLPEAAMRKITSFLDPSSQLQLAAVNRGFLCNARLSLQSLLDRGYEYPQATHVFVRSNGGVIVPTSVIQAQSSALQHVTLINMTPYEICTALQFLPSSFRTLTLLDCLGSFPMPVSLPPLPHLTKLRLNMATKDMDAIMTATRWSRCSVLQELELFSVVPFQTPQWEPFCDAVTWSLCDSIRHVTITNKLPARRVQPLSLYLLPQLRSFTMDNKVDDPRTILAAASFTNCTQLVNIRLHRLRLSPAPMGTIIPSLQSLQITNMLTDVKDILFKIRAPALTSLTTTVPLEIDGCMCESRPTTLHTLCLKTTHPKVCVHYWSKNKQLHDLTVVALPTRRLPIVLPNLSVIPCKTLTLRYATVTVDSLSAWDATSTVRSLRFEHCTLAETAVEVLTTEFGSRGMDIIIDASCDVEHKDNDVLSLGSSFVGCDSQ